MELDDKLNDKDEREWIRLEGITAVSIECTHDSCWFKKMDPVVASKAQTLSKEASALYIREWLERHKENCDQQ